MNSYKAILTDCMTKLAAKSDKVVFTGYNISRPGGFAAGTLSGVPEDRLIECVLAENVMLGAAIGLSLEGFYPITFFERMDFLLNAMDPLVNHLDRLRTLSRGMHQPAVIIRCAVGNSKKPLYTGPTHTQCFAKALRLMLSMEVLELEDKNIIAWGYTLAWDRMQRGESTILVEFRDRYDE